MYLENSLYHRTSRNSRLIGRQCTSQIEKHYHKDIFCRIYRISNIKKWIPNTRSFLLQYTHRDRVRITILYQRSDKFSNFLGKIHNKTCHLNNIRYHILSIINHLHLNNYLLCINKSKKFSHIYNFEDKLHWMISYYK